MRWKVSIRIHYGRRSAVLALAGLCLVVALLAVRLPQAQGRASAAQAEPASSPAAYPEMRKYYLTTTSHNGSQATGACASGYHMASLWEILDPSHLQYDTLLGDSRGRQRTRPSLVHPRMGAHRLQL